MRPFSPVFILTLSLSVSAFAQNTSMPAGTSQFSIVQDGKPIGTTESTITPTPNGYLIDSHGEMHLAKFSYSFTNHNQLDPSFNLVRDQLTGTVNGSQASVEVASSTDGRQLDLHVQGQGKTESNTVDRHRNLVLLPDFDAASYEEMVHFALLHPQTSWVLIPKETGILVPADYEPQYAVRGTLNGTPITVQHTTVAISAQNAVSVELYFTQDGSLLEADLPEQNFYVIRDGFHLVNRPKPTPPRAPSGAPQPGQADQPQQQQYQYPPQQQPQ
jgi:hypothetical protein